MSEQWTIKSALEWTEGYLERKGDENPRLSAQWLLSEATGYSRVELYAHFDQPLTMSEREILRDIVSRRGTGEPLQYITGEVAFRYINVKVKPGVLIPRPETEVLVSEVLALLPSCKREGIWSDSLDLSKETNAVPVLSESAHFEEASSKEEGGKQQQDDAEQGQAREILIADICTGSGCIACSIAHEYPNSRVLASDIDQTALSLAQENADLLHLAERIDFFQGDLGEAIPQSYQGTLDIIVSNPPYIPHEVLKSIPAEVSDFEPTLALDGGEDGLLLYRRLVPWAYAMLREEGAFVVELHETCLAEAAEIAHHAGFSSTKVVQDLAGRDRILVAKRSSIA